MEKKLPAWTEMVEETTVLTKSDLRRLFPDATILVEGLIRLFQVLCGVFWQSRIQVFSVSIASLQATSDVDPIL